MSYAFDPELASSAAAMSPLPLDDIAAARATIAELAAELPPVDTSGLDVGDSSVPGAPGDPAVAIRIYRPRTGATGAALLFLHAGGVVLGGLDSEHALCARLATDVGAVLVSVGYRLAPEHPYPAAAEDCYAVYMWLTQNAAELGVDSSRIGIIGRSAGGGLTAAVTLMARDRGAPRARFQYLEVPMLDDRLATASARQFTDTPIWNRRSCELAWRYYLGDAAGTESVSPYAAPARATDLSGLPPAYIQTAEFDPLRDEGISYAQRLLDAGVAVELHSTPGTFHSSSEVEPDAKITLRLNAERLAVLHRALA